MFILRMSLTYLDKMIHITFKNKKKIQWLYFCGDNNKSQ